MLDEISFGYLLSPSTLEADLNSLSKDEIGALLKTFLLVFQSEQAKSNNHSVGMYSNKQFLRTGPTGTAPYKGYREIETGLLF